MKGGVLADVGTLILTNKRLVYICKGDAARVLAWVALNPFVAPLVEKKVSSAKLDELSKSERSYSIPLTEITNVEADRKLGNAYLRVDHPNVGKGVHSYIFGSGWGTNKEWVLAINSARASTKTPSARPTPDHTPPPKHSSVSKTQATEPTYPKFCSNCGAKVSPGARFCSSCGSRLSQQ